MIPFASPNLGRTDVRSIVMSKRTPQDASWNSEPASSFKRRGRAWGWLWKTALVVGLLGISGAIIVITQLESMSRKAWPAVRQVSARLQTDEGARDLWAKNPELQQGYPDQEGFLSQVKLHRTAFANLPALEPPRDGETLQIESWPIGIMARLKSQDGTWMQLTIERVPVVGDVAQQGEGITELVFADRGGSLEESRREARQAQSNRRWSRFRENAVALQTDDGAKSLYQAQPGLKKHFPTENDFLVKARAWRPQLESLPEDSREDGGHLQLHIYTSPLGEQQELAYTTKSGMRLRQNWSNGQLVELSLDATSR